MIQDTLEIFGKPLKLKQYYCAWNGQEPEEVPKPYINLYVRTKFCNARCGFCIYHSDANKWNNDRWEEVLQELSSKIDVGKLSITGGEPTLYWDKFKQITDTAEKYLDYKKTDYQVTTDGFRWEQLWNDPIHEKMFYIQLSRHHYDDEKNNEIFGCKTPTTDEIKSIIDKQTHPHQFQLRCNLIQGYLDNTDEVFKYLDWANNIGINDIGLVSLMPVNGYSKDNFVYFHIKDLIGDNFHFARKQEKVGGGCECFNYVYLPENNFRQPIRVYHKNTFKPSVDANSITEVLSFDGYNLRVGYDGEILF